RVLFRSEEELKRSKKSASRKNCGIRCRHFCHTSGYGFQRNKCFLLSGLGVCYRGFRQFAGYFVFTLLEENLRKGDCRIDYRRYPIFVAYHLNLAHHVGSIWIRCFKCLASIGKSGIDFFSVGRIDRLLRVFMVSEAEAGSSWLKNELDSMVQNRAHF